MKLVILFCVLEFLVVVHVQCEPQEFLSSNSKKDNVDFDQIDLELKSEEISDVSYLMSLDVDSNKEKLPKGDHGNRHTNNNNNNNRQNERERHRNRHRHRSTTMSSFAPAAAPAAAAPPVQASPVVMAPAPAPVAPVAAAPPAPAAPMYPIITGPNEVRVEATTTVVAPVVTSAPVAPVQATQPATMVPIITAAAPVTSAPVPAQPAAPVAPVTEAASAPTRPTVDPVHHLNQVDKILGNVANLNIVGIVDESLAIRAPQPVRNLVTNIMKIIFCNPIDRIFGRCAPNQIAAANESAKG